MTNETRNQKTPVLFTMGKVASSSLTMAFRNADIPSHHIHNLNPQTLQKIAEPDTKAGHAPVKHVSQSLSHRREYIDHPERFLFISLVRDPVARNISAFFQNLHLAEKETGVENDIEVLFERFLKTYPHRLPLRWFDHQFQKYLNVDIYKHAFNKTKKFRYLPQKNTLLMRIDCPRADKEQLLSDIFNTPIAVPDANVGDQKDYSERYIAFKNHARFEDAFLARIYNSPFCRHFWTNQERREMRKRWSI